MGSEACAEEREASDTVSRSQRMRAFSDNDSVDQSNDWDTT